MKRLFSALLAVLMVLTSVSFAAPTAVPSIETAEEVAEAVEVPAAETQEEQAETAEEAVLFADGDYGTLIASIDFEQLETSSLLKHQASFNS